MPLQEILGERLGAFELCCRGAGPEAGESLFLESIDDACNERALRADDRQADRLGFGELDQSVHVIGRDGNIAHACLDRRACISGCDQDLVNPRGLGALPCQGVLPAATAYYQDFHRFNPFNAGNGACR